MIRNVLQKLLRFGRAEDGTATVEFVLVFPAFMILFLSAFESGLLMTRHVMLERGLDMTVREIRLNTSITPTHNQVRKMVCNGAGIIPDCLETLKLELITIDPRNWQALRRSADCIDVDRPYKPVRNFVNGTQNQIMIVRVCSLFKPMFPGTGLGFQLPRKTGDYYALVSMAAFVMEPL